MWGLYCWTTKFEPETTFENNSDEIKAYHIKASPHLTWIYKPSLQKTLFIFWTFKRQSPEIGSNKITCKITTIHQTFVFCAPSRKHPTKNSKMVGWSWIIILYIHFWSSFFQYLSTNRTICTAEKTLKQTVHFFKTTIIHPSRVLISNVKLKRASKVYHVIYNYWVGKTTTSKCQHTIKPMINVRMIIVYVHVTTNNLIIGKLLSVPIIHFNILVWFYIIRRVQTNLSVKVSNSGHPVKCARKYCRNKYLSQTTLLNSSILHRPLYTPMYSYGSTYEDTFCASPSPAQENTVLDKNCHILY